ncbi:hypothetical protein CRYUN_Cryun16bG0016200 [Craigia yunnanensis]
MDKNPSPALAYRNPQTGRKNPHGVADDNYFTGLLVHVLNRTILLDRKILLSDKEFVHVSSF